MDHKSTAVSIIISTYNRPDALQLVLRALANQSSQDFEAVIADDGSKNDTKKIIDEFKQRAKYKITHIWQPDDGFRLSMIRNRAVAVASGEYLVFLDGDTIPGKDFVKRHIALSESGYFVSGNRALLSEDFTAKVLTESLPIYNWNLLKWLYAFINGWSNRFFGLLFLPFYYRYFNKNRWQGAKGCNLAVWRSDFIRVNGFDESYSGWGYEDSDFVIRLLRAGVLRKDGRFATAAFHLWHPSNVTKDERENYKRLQQIIDSKRVEAVIGIDRYL